MAEKKKGNQINLEPTRGTFQLKGIVTGVEKPNFYAEGLSKTGKQYRKVSFGVEVAPNEIVFVSLFGSVMDNVYFSKSEKHPDGSTTRDTKTVRWADRMTFNENGYRLIGVNCGCSKVLDENGSERNDTKTLTPFDACREIRKLKDGQSVFVRGNITYSEYNGKHQTNFEIQQVSLMQDIDFEADDFEREASFGQTIVYRDCTRIEGKDNEFAVNAYCIGYNSVNEAEFRTHNAKFMLNLKKHLHPYDSIFVYGNIAVDIVEEEVDDDENCWGDANPMKKAASPYERYLLIIGADGASLDTETYSEDAVDNALAYCRQAKVAQAEYGNAPKSKPSDTFDRSSLMGDDDDDDFDVGE